MNGRIVMVTTGSFGDVNPFVGLALELKARGHRPVIISAPIWRQWIENAGIESETFESGWDIPSENLAHCLDPAALAKPAAESYGELARRVRSDDVLVSLTMIGLGPIVAAPLVAEARGIPWIAVVLEPLSFFSAHEELVLPSFAGQQPTLSIGAAIPWSPLWWWQQVFSLECRCLLAMGAAMQALRPGLGLAPTMRGHLTDFHHADLVLALFSELIARRQADWPRQTQLVGFVSYDGYSRQPWPAQLEQFLNDGPSPIVFTLSSDAVLAPDANFWDKCVFAARAVGCRAVIVGLTLPGDAEAVVTNGNRDVCFVRSASFASLFPRAAAIVHHGGIGTTALALRAGKPMLVIPGDYAQPDIAARLNRLGVARVLPRSQFTGQAAAAELLPLLASPVYRVAAKRAAGVLASEDGVRAACDAIEHLLESRTARRAYGFSATSVSSSTGPSGV